MRLEVQVNLSPQIAYPLICHSVISICCSGFSSISSIDEFRELIVSENTLAVAEDPEDDIRREPRIQVSSRFLVECLNGVSFAMFNGYANLALRALSAIHQRAQYELYSDVLLFTNALCNLLRNNNAVKALLVV